jgi:hypothetical protein
MARMFGWLRRASRRASRDAAGRGELGTEHLDRDQAVEPGVPRAKDMTHAAGAELGLDKVARRERRSGTELKGIHRRGCP